MAAAAEATAVKESKEEKERERQARIMWRDFTFLATGVVAASIMGYMELHSADVEMRGGDPTRPNSNKHGILDAGYIATQGIHDFLEQHREWNDIFAFINSVIGVFGPGIYMVYQTLWVGDYDIIFRYACISALRSYCGWFTYLPPDPEYLMSNYDFPDIAQCLTKECGDPRDAEINPFVSFFSGHVATLVACANHMYLHGYKTMGLGFHAFNVFQIIRLLATRGHYSIDIIIGWFMAAFVSNPAGRLGRHYSRGNEYMSDLLPASAEEAFEGITGIDAARNDSRMSKLLKKPEFKDALRTVSEEQQLRESLPEPTARLYAEGKLMGPPKKLD